MSDETIKAAFERDSYVVVEDIIDATELEPMRGFIKVRVDDYAREQHAELGGMGSRGAGGGASVHDATSC
jgi:ectoine hydroxylase-related dioxygenase (phytanoyl-CoA dioxygenase family)